MPPSVITLIALEWLTVLGLSSNQTKILHEFFVRLIIIGWTLVIIVVIRPLLVIVPVLILGVIRVASVLVVSWVEILRLDIWLGQNVELVLAFERISLSSQLLLVVQWPSFVVRITRFESVWITNPAIILELLLERVFVLFLELVHLLNELHHIDLAIPLVDVAEVHIAKPFSLLFELLSLVDVRVPLSQIEDFQELADSSTVRWTTATEISASNRWLVEQHLKVHLVGSDDSSCHTESQMHVVFRDENNSVSNVRIVWVIFEGRSCYLLIRVVNYQEVFVNF